MNLNFEVTNPNVQQKYRFSQQKIHFTQALTSKTSPFENELPLPFVQAAIFVLLLFSSWNYTRNTKLLLRLVIKRFENLDQYFW